MSLPRDRNGDGYVNDLQVAAALRWAARHRKAHKGEGPWERFDRAEAADEAYRDRHR